MRTLPSESEFKRKNCFIRLFAISPLEESTITTTLHAIFMLFMTLGIFAYEITGRISIGFLTALVTSSITIAVGTLNTITDVVCNIILTLSPLFLSGDTKKNVLEEVEDLDNILRKYRTIQHGKNDIYIHLIILHLVYCSLVINDIYPWLVTNNSEYYQYYFFDHFYRYRLSVLVIYAASLINGLQRRISCVNAILSEELQRIFNQNPDSEMIGRLEDITQDMSNAYAKFINLIQFFNRMFGWQMLAIFLNYIFLFLTAFDVGLRIMRKSESVNQQLFYWAFVSLIYAMVWNFYYFVFF